MLSLTELRYLADVQSSYHILKPWWEVFWHYLSLIMLVVAVVTGTLQITADNLLCCLPCQVELEDSCVLSERPIERNFTPSTNLTSPKGVRTNLHRQQYLYISAVCYENELHWFPKYFPYLVLLHSLIFAACGNFWLQYPSTSSRLEHFVSILYTCFDSPWTTRALSETAAEQRFPFTKTDDFLSRFGLNKNVNTSKHAFFFKQPGVDSGIASSASSVLGKREGEQAKAIFEKVKRFRLHVEQSDVIYRVYIRQIIIQVIVFVIIIAYVPYFLTYITLEIDCPVDLQAFTGYNRYHCVYSLAELFQVIASFYVILVLIYGLTSSYSLWWILRSSLKEYSFESKEKSHYSDIPDVKNDFAFILHLADQHDPLYSQRFSIFLSEVSENKLNQINLNNQWTMEKLKNKLVRNSEDKVELHLFMFSGLPDGIFELTEIEVLTLELMPEVKLPTSISQLVNLKELNLYSSNLVVDRRVLNFLKENLKILRLKFSERWKVPRWIFHLKSLRELYFSGYIISETLTSSVQSEGFQDLKNLKTLCIKSTLTRIPLVITEMLPGLHRLAIDNGGYKLAVLHCLKKMIHLKILELNYCDLDRIPHTLFSLVNLHELDLKENNIKAIEEVCFQYFQRILSLKLWHNYIVSIPTQIGSLSNLEQLYLDHNKIENLPLQLFLCTKLTHLDVSYNNLTVIPEEIQFLTNLLYFAATKNFIETLPDGLFRCKKLQTLLLGRNSLNTLSPLIGELTNLVQLELIGNYLDILPHELEACPSLKRSCVLVEENLLNTLSPVIIERLQVLG
ncbi:volume-regulated anion channel subunit LRRC8B-like [Gracilinanus agilis]|uniref:volume-regulated anion channel subunit LRRC8B-like n=1 Tax=Gracilinanus agilis TaxID=191870 RepID=UPI001CFE92C7|nr:volume-regulated anion channel subunit LRRC8B-like [Gracilinanus agilis]